MKVACTVWSRGKGRDNVKALPIAIYKVEFSETSLGHLKKLDKSVQTIILKWIKKNLVDCNNPKAHGKALVGNKKGFWRYRVGNYRLLCNIHDEVLTILVLEVGHRSEIYK